MLPRRAQEDCEASLPQTTRNSEQEETLKGCAAKEDH